MLDHLRVVPLVVLLCLPPAWAHTAMRYAKDFYNPDLPTCGIQAAINSQRHRDRRPRHRGIRELDRGHRRCALNGASRYGRRRVVGAYRSTFARVSAGSGVHGRIRLGRHDVLPKDHGRLAPIQFPRVLAGRLQDRSGLADGLRVEAAHSDDLDAPGQQLGRLSGSVGVCLEPASQKTRLTRGAGDGMIPGATL